MKTIKNFFCVTRDQVRLATDLYMPDQEGAYPVILMRTPYDKEGIVREPLYEHYPEFVEAGYVVAIQDCRGTCASEGKMNLNGGNEQDDGYDAVEFLATQPFCDGNVGMFGLSYFGFTQIAAAAGAPAHLKAICPFMCCSLSSFGTSSMQTVASFHLGWAYTQLLEHASQYMPDKSFRNKMVPILEENRDRLGEYAKVLPMNQNPAALLEGVPMLRVYGDNISEKRGKGRDWRGQVWKRPDFRRVCGGTAPEQGWDVAVILRKTASAAVGAFFAPRKAPEGPTNGAAGDNAQTYESPQNGASRPFLGACGIK